MVCGNIPVNVHVTGLSENVPPSSSKVLMIWIVPALNTRFAIDVVRVARPILDFDDPADPREHSSTGDHTGHDLAGSCRTGDDDRTVELLVRY